jgi:hypothetical protein
MAKAVLESKRVDVPWGLAGGSAVAMTPLGAVLLSRNVCPLALLDRGPAGVDG